MTTQEILEAIQEAKSLRQITQAFTQIASSKLKKIRNGVERNRIFFHDLSGIYGLVNAVARKRNIPRPAKNGRTLVLLLTSNERFYGKITGELLEFFVVQISKIRADKLVMGRSGIETLKSMNYALSYTPLILESDFPTNAEFVKLSQLVQDYSKVLVFHPQFQSVMLQKPVIADITLSEQEVDLKSRNSQSMVDEYNNYIVEPEVKIMADFFDNQIKVLLLESTFLEAELARTASRLVSMDSAQNEAEKYLSTQQLSLINAQRSIQNARILETIAALRR